MYSEHLSCAECSAKPFVKSSHTPYHSSLNQIIIFSLLKKVEELAQSRAASESQGLDLKSSLTPKSVLFIN